MTSTISPFIAFLCLLLSTSSIAIAAPAEFLQSHCLDCHNEQTQEGGLNLAALPQELSQPENFARWVRIYDRIIAGEMPPAEEERPPADAVASYTSTLHNALIAAETARFEVEGRTGLRRLTRLEYENTIRDLFDMPGIALQASLPPDGSAHGFDNNADALDISHVNILKYVEAADHTLNFAIATRPEPPTVHTRRISLANRGGFVAHIIMNGDGVLLRDKKPDPEFPPASEYRHIDQGAHERMGSFETGSTVGLFRHEDESVSPYFSEHVTIYPGLYRVRTSLWSFQWDKGQVLPARGTEAARLSVVQLTGDGRGGQHPSYVLGYYDAPSLQSQEHEVITWLNHNEQIGFNAASLAPTANYNRKGRAMAFTGPGIAVDWLDIEGPLHEVWPPKAHRILFGDLPLEEFKQPQQPDVRAPVRLKIRQIGAGQNRPDPDIGLYTVASKDPLADADRLLANFLPRAFRRPVSDELRRPYVDKVEQRLQAGDCFETAMRWAYRAALCSPDFLYHVEPQHELDDHALACRLSYFLWNSLPDAHLRQLADSGQLRQPEVLHGEVERLLEDPKSERFITDFLGQWLKLYKIAANDPDRKLYPEFSPYLQDSMLAESHAYFRELLEQNLGVEHLVKSDFAMLNQKLATHYDIPGVVGSQMQRVPLPEDCPRGGLLTQAAVLKVTANGTTTSPVPRGAFVLDRILGQPPLPPPANVPAIEPDVQGAKSIRDQLEKHRADAVCASCHKDMDPPGFALESFDVIGGYRDRYRSIGEGDPAPRGSIDPFIGISFKLGPAVDPSGVLVTGEAFEGIRQFQTLLAAQEESLLKNLAQQFAVYATGREVAFSDREALAEIVTATQEGNGGIRTLVHELVQSKLFAAR